MLFTGLSRSQVVPDFFHRHTQTTFPQHVPNKNHGFGNLLLRPQRLISAPYFWGDSPEMTETNMPDQHPWFFFQHKPWMAVFWKNRGVIVVGRWSWLEGPKCNLASGSVSNRKGGLYWFKVVCSVYHHHESANIILFWCVFWRKEPLKSDTPPRKYFQGQIIIDVSG